MRPMIDDLELPQVQTLTVRDRRALAEHRPPGLDGSLLQNLGRSPTRLTLSGVASGADALSWVERLDEKFRIGQPVTFIADIVADAEIEEMVIDDLRIREVAGKADRYSYRLSLEEYLEPVEPEDTTLLDDEILADAERLIDDLVAGLDISLDFATGLERFLPAMEGLLGRLQQFQRDVESTRGG